MASLEKPDYWDLTSHQQRLVNKAVAEGVPQYIATCIMVSTSRYRHIGFVTGLALFEQESQYQHVFGHDPTIFIGAGVVTRVKYLAYRTRRKLSRNRLMQGVGVGQLTWWETQDYADRRGGCWKRYVNVDVSIETLARLIASFGYVKGIERYNGSGPRAIEYSVSVRRRADRWRRILT